MTKTYQLPKRGEVHTSPCNAGSLTGGDVIIDQHQRQWTEIHSAHEVQVNGELHIHLKGRMSGLAWEIVTPINRPMDRVVGARSAGQIV